MDSIVAEFHRVYGRPYKHYSDAELRRRLRSAFKAVMNDPDQRDALADVWAECFARNWTEASIDAIVADLCDDEGIEAHKRKADREGQSMIDRATSLLLRAECDGDQEAAAVARQVLVDTRRSRHPNAN